MPRLNRVLGGLGLLILAAILGSFLYFTWNGTFEATFVSAAVTSMLVMVTGISVFFTLLLLEENRIARKREFEPAFSVYLEPIAIGVFDVVLENIGNGPAQDVEATLTLFPSEITWDFQRKNVRPGDKAPAFITNENITFRQKSSKDFDKITVEGKCTDVFGNRVNFSNTYNMELLKSGEHEQHLPYENRTERNLKDISRSLKDIKKALK